MLLHNPALLANGGKTFKWFGTKLTIMPALESATLAQNLLQGGGLGDDLVENLFQSPIHLGISGAFTLLSKYGGIAFVSRSEPDLRAWKRGDISQGAGTPNIVIRSETIGGLYASYAQKLGPLSLGISGKYLLLSRINEYIDLSDRNAISNIDSRILDLDLANPPQGIGIDLGSMILLKSSYLDLRLAYTLENLGSMSLSNKQILPQISHAGVGLTLHTTADAIHLALDLRDIEDKQKTPLYQRIHTGVKMMLRTYIGIAAGVYHGSPSYGLEIDALIFRIAISTYTREYHPTPGLDSRRIIMASYSSGFTL